MEIGQVCEKLTGNEKGRICIVIDSKDKNFVLIDGDVKRRRCNLNHLKPLDKVVKISENDDTDKIRDILKREGFKLIGRKVKVKERLRVKRENKNSSKGK